MAPRVPKTSKKTIENMLILSPCDHRSINVPERRHSISVCDLDTIGKENAKHRANDLMEDIDFNEDSRNHVANMWEKNNFGKSLECLSLTLKEVQHIRSVLTKAK